MQDYAKYLIETFGIPEEIARKFKFVERGKSVWAYTGEIQPKKWESLGIRAFRLGRGIKPTTDFLRLIGRYATRNVVEVDENNLKTILKGGEIECEEKIHGFVIIKYGNFVVGCGYAKGGKVISMIPKRYRYQETWI